MVFVFFFHLDINKPCRTLKIFSREKAREALRLSPFLSYGSQNVKTAIFILWIDFECNFHFDTDPGDVDRTS